MQSKYINPFTDFGFKKLFGEEASKPALIDFLNALLPSQSQVMDISFKNTEQLGDSLIDRKAIYDIYCENQQGEKFIVELQKAKQNYFKERTVYYSTYPIREQAEKGEWNFNLKAVYCIGVLDFTFNDDPAETDVNEVVQTIQLKDKAGRIFYEKLTYIYLEMPNFRKSEDQLVTRLDRWLYFIKHLEDFQAIPEIFKNDVVFLQSFEKAALAKLNELEREGYEYSLKVYRDLKNVIDFAEEDGDKKGFVRGVTEAATKAATVMKQNGITLDIIIQATGLTRDEIEKL